jgi:hypothetical protein
MRNACWVCRAGVRVHLLRKSWIAGSSPIVRPGLAEPSPLGGYRGHAPTVKSRSPVVRPNPGSTATAPNHVGAIPRAGVCPAPTGYSWGRERSSAPLHGLQPWFGSSGWADVRAAAPAPGNAGVPSHWSPATRRSQKGRLGDSVFLVSAGRMARDKCCVMNPALCRVLRFSQSTVAGWSAWVSTANRPIGRFQLMYNDLCYSLPLFFIQLFHTSYNR